MSLFARELPPTAGLPMQASDFLPGGGDLRDILASQLGTPPLQLTCSGTHALLIALRTLRKRLDKVGREIKIARWEFYWVLTCRLK